jgi:hypothetical protein
MAWLQTLLGSVEFWMALSALAALLPGPQTRLFPLIFRAVAETLARRAAARKE